MKTIKTKTIGPHIILDKFDELPICPESTRLATKNAIENLPQAKAAEEKRRVTNMHNARSRAALLAGRKADYIVKNKDSIIAQATAKGEDVLKKVLIEIEQAKQNVSKEKKNYDDFSAQSKSAEIELSECNKVFQVAKRDYLTKNPVYFGARKDEVICTDSQIEELKTAFESKGENKQVKLVLNSTESVIIEANKGHEEIKETVYSIASHELIDDFRGKQYFFLDLDGNWIESQIIERLGDTKNTVAVDDFQDQAIEKADLNQSQSEEIRIQNMDSEQKTLEKDSAIKSALSQSAQMKAELEITGSTAVKALADSKAFYQSEVEKIELKYG